MDVVGFFGSQKVDPIVHPMGFFLMAFDSKSGREWATV
jgi:hypothetical protein